MAEIINLRMARKRATRLESDQKAEANRAMHSIPARERKVARLNDAKSAASLDGHRRKTPGKPEQD
ncbi:MAG: DUF4169 family protein [Nitratireductor sp.]